jgi:hypothetical protein
MKDFLEIIKASISIITILAVTGLGYAISQLFIVIDFFDKNGNIL